MALGPGWVRLALRRMPLLDHAVLHDFGLDHARNFAATWKQYRQSRVLSKIDRRRGAVMPQPEPDSTDYGRVAIYPLSDFHTVLAL